MATKQRAGGELQASAKYKCLWYSLVFAKFGLIPDLAAAASHWKAFADVDRRLHPAYMTAMFCLTLLRVIDDKSHCVRAGVNDLLTAILTDFENCITTTTADAAVVLQLALYLMQMSLKADGSTSSSVCLHLSHAHLKTVLRCNNRGGNNVRSLADVYLAVQHCITGKYRSAIRHCKRIIGTVDRSVHVVHGGSLFTAYQQ
jgi:hypothetical protein